MQGEPVNLREQQDAVEFFMSLVESLDEALKSLGLEQYMAKTLGGTYSDQKICKGCPHRLVMPNGKLMKTEKFIINNEDTSFAHRFYLM